MRLSDRSCKYFRANDILNSFLSDVRKFSVPTVEEEEKLVEQYKNGDEKAKDALINGNLRFVFSLAKIYARDESEVMDYVDEGVIGLMTALKEYDLSKGTRFLTYGVWYIRRQMNYYLLTKRGLISHSAQVGNIAKKSDVIRQKYYARNGVLPTDEEVLKVLEETFNIKVSKIDDIHESNVSSIDEDVSDDYTMEETSEYNTKTASYNDYESEIDREFYASIVGEYLKSLPQKVAKIICLRFGIGVERPYSSEEISRMTNISAERIEDICNAAILEMRSASVSKKAI